MTNILTFSNKLIKKYHIIKLGKEFSNETLQSKFHKRNSKLLNLPFIYNIKKNHLNPKQQQIVLQT